MGTQNDSINQAISPEIKNALNESTMSFIDILAEAGVDVTAQIDFNPSTGEIIESEKTKRGLAGFLKELETKEISWDRVMFKDNLNESGFYIHQGRKITNGVIVSEGRCLGFVPVQVVKSAVSYAAGKEQAEGVIV